MIRIEAEVPRNDLMSVSDALRIIDVSVNIAKVKGRGKGVGSKVHAAKGTEMYRSEFQDKYLVQITVPDNIENDVVEILKSNSKTGKITIFQVSRVIDIGSGVENEQALALNEYDSVILTAAKNQNTSFPFGFATENLKVAPPPIERFQILSADDSVVIESMTRVKRNFSLYKMKMSDSYSQAFLKYVASRFLSLWPEQEINVAILYVDIVGSSKLATLLSSEELSGLIKVFSEEMSVIVSKHAGFVLKYAGDAVIAFFPELEEFGNMAENAIRCANSMNMLIKYSLNPIFSSLGLPTISVRIGVDAGKNRIVFLGSEPDLIGHSITIVSKILPLAQPNQTTIGDSVYQMLPREFAEQFTKINPDDKRWNYTHPATGAVYPIYFSRHLVQISDLKA